MTATFDWTCESSRPQRPTVAAYLRWVEQVRPNAKGHEQVKVIARSPSSLAGRLLMENLEFFARKGFDVLAVFTKTRAKADIAHVVQLYDKAFGTGRSDACLRFSDFRGAKDVRELLDIGTAATTLDKQTTSLDALEVPSIVPDAPTQFARKLAFDAVWAVSYPPSALR